MTGNQGFTVFVAGNGTLNSTSIGGPVAIGGNLTIGTQGFNVATHTAGTFTAPGDAQPTGLLVNGSVNWAGSGSNGAVNVQLNDYAKVGNMTGSAVAQSGSAPTHVVRAGQGYNVQPFIADVINQPTASVNQSGLIGFSSAFTTFRTNSANLANCTNTVVLQNANGTSLPGTLPPSTNAYVPLTSGVQNILNITAANLNNITTMQFNNNNQPTPSASTPLIINVDTTGVGNNFTWTPPNFNGLQNSSAPYILWNFPTATTLTVSGSRTIPGTIYAPGSTVVETDQSGINGAMVAATYTQGGTNGSSNGGEVGQVMPYAFAATVQSCAAAGQLTITKIADVPTTTPGSTVHYTITVTNSGSVAYTGANFTDPLTGVIDDAVYNGDASATTGSVSFSNPNLAWTGDVAVGATATITYSVTVRSPDPGNHVLSNTVTSTTAGSNCPSGSTDGRCTATVSVSDLTILKTPDVSTTTPGSTVHYTILVTNAGQTAYTSATFTDPLGGVLDDATYNNNVTVSSGGGTAGYASPNLTWTGNLAIGASATITYSVTVTNPDTGNHLLSNTVTSATAGSNCPSGSTDARCTVTVSVSGLTIVKTADVSTTTPGSTVHYTITVTNTGLTTFTGATFSDDLTGLLDDATYGGNATVTAGLGSVSYASPYLTWTGNLSPAQVATITYSATVAKPDTGNGALTNTVTSATAGSNCPSGNSDPRCTVTVTVMSLTILKTASASTTTPGATVGYIILVTNTGPTAYTGATFTDSLTGVLEDATYNGDAAASSGTATFASPNVTWTGNLAIGGSATITYSVTVNSPDLGDRILVNTVSSLTPGSNCGSGSTDSGCTVTVADLVPGLDIVNSADVATTTPGATVHYTVTVTNTGQSAYTGATFTDPLGGVLDDATFVGAPAASAGSATFTSPNLTWTGNLAVGAAATITYSVTINSPDTGNAVLASTITSATAGSNCPVSGGTDPGCTATVKVAQLTLVNTANVATTTPGGVVRYTATFTNTGAVPYAGITIAAGAADVFDDATPNGDQTATSGTLTLTGSGVSWTGYIGVGGVVTVTGTVTVNNPDTGNKSMTSTLTSSAAGNNCPAGGSDPRCSVTVTVQIPALTIVKTPTVTSAVPGAVIGFTVTVTNTGQAAYTGATVTDSFAQMADDATYAGGATTTAGTLSYASPNSDLDREPRRRRGRDDQLIR